MREDPAMALARFVTIDDRLAPALNASPMLANLICVELDLKLYTFASRSECLYSRYVDDITISTAKDSSQLPARGQIRARLEI
jgi:hypothetical protein